MVRQRRENSPLEEAIARILVPIFVGTVLLSLSIGIYLVARAVATEMTITIGHIAFYVCFVWFVGTAVLRYA